jgi:hypothetical protein
MLPLDHIPFYDLDPDALALGFGKLGFTASPPSRYTAPDHPDAEWRGRCIFTRNGWLDLLFDENPRNPATPEACLFRAPDLAAASAEAAILNPGEPVRLERRWAGEPGLPAESFAYVGLGSRIAPVGFALITHAWPCVDVRAEWFEHANGARRIGGLIFGGEAPGPAAASAGRVLDLAGVEYWSRATFDAAFPGTPARRALQVAVDDLDVTRAVLRASGARFGEIEQGIAVPAQFGVNCGVLFRGVLRPASVASSSPVS